MRVGDVGPQGSGHALVLFAKGDEIDGGASLRGDPHDLARHRPEAPGVLRRLDDQNAPCHRIKPGLWEQPWVACMRVVLHTMSSEASSSFASSPILNHARRPDRRLPGRTVACLAPQAITVTRVERRTARRTELAADSHVERSAEPASNARLTVDRSHNGEIATEPQAGNPRASSACNRKVSHWRRHHQSCRPCRPARGPVVLFTGGAFTIASIAASVLQTVG